MYRYRHAGAKEERIFSSSFLTSTVDGVSGQRHAQVALYPRGKDRIGGWVGLRADLITEARGKILCLCRG
jgi:hypothetical protein